MSKGNMTVSSGGSSPKNTEIKKILADKAMTFISNERFEKYTSGNKEVAKALIKEGVISVSKYEGYDIHLDKLSKEAQKKAEERETEYRRSGYYMPGGGIKRRKN